MSGSRDLGVAWGSFRAVLSRSIRSRVFSMGISSAGVCWLRMISWREPTDRGLIVLSRLPTSWDSPRAWERQSSNCLSNPLPEAFLCSAC